MIKKSVSMVAVVPESSRRSGCEDGLLEDRTQWGKVSDLKHLQSKLISNARREIRRRSRSDGHSRRSRRLSTPASEATSSRRPRRLSTPGSVAISVNGSSTRRSSVCGPNHDNISVGRLSSGGAFMDTQRTTDTVSTTKSDFKTLKWMKTRNKLFYPELAATETRNLKSMYRVIKDLDFEQQIAHLRRLFQELGYNMTKRDVEERFRVGKGRQPISFRQFCTCIKSFNLDYRRRNDSRIEPPMSLLMPACLRKHMMDEILRGKRSRSALPPVSDQSRKDSILNDMDSMSRFKLSLRNERKFASSLHSRRERNMSTPLNPFNATQKPVRTRYAKRGGSKGRLVNTSASFSHIPKDTGEEDDPEGSVDPVESVVRLRWSMLVSKMKRRERCLRLRVEKLVEEDDSSNDVKNEITIDAKHEGHRRIITKIREWLGRARERLRGEIGPFVRKNMRERARSHFLADWAFLMDTVKNKKPSSQHLTPKPLTTINTPATTPSAATRWSAPTPTTSPSILSSCKLP
mmetsp:Transcript_8093/g.15842  ORF Transcript_8093/g.15842 Transcript_8093/m.15842 type:complete len:518 (-) Transcript_8093:336-1889(-)|eukprot:CAMPEP_0167813434 /NCGR_PEP_ID=MMETSP0112_2-20121227/1852_1 /TAXON_ID=91324 /ORGANISM="Lotharella globosa, Strain CCCM811" /LENGTH=517 /DNA_ID=CAMNT_0007712517 /DNA_START=62 /DNA_END=1615 /DNA_ORIENTATION=-